MIKVYRLVDGTIKFRRMTAEEESNAIKTVMFDLALAVGSFAFLLICSGVLA